MHEFTIILGYRDFISESVTVDEVTDGRARVSKKQAIKNVVKSKIVFWCINAFDLAKPNLMAIVVYVLPAAVVLNGQFNPTCGGYLTTCGVVS